MAILIGLLLGILLGLTGAGGAIFAVPLLVILLSLPLSEAMGIALAAVAASAMLGTYLHRHNVMWLPAFIVTLAGIITAPLGKWLAISTNETALTLSLSFLSLYIAYSMWKKSTLSEPTTFSPTDTSSINNQWLALSAGGLGIGLASGLFGVGGGFLIIPFLMAISHISMKQAVSTSLSAISMISLAGFISHEIFTHGQAIKQPMVILIPLISSALVAMLISKQISNSLSDKTLKRGFSLLLFIVTLVMMIKQLAI